MRQGQRNSSPQLPRHFTGCCARMLVHSRTARILYVALYGRHGTCSGEAFDSGLRQQPAPEIVSSRNWLLRSRWVCTHTHKIYARKPNCMRLSWMGLFGGKTLKGSVLFGNARLVLQCTLARDWINVRHASCIVHRYDLLRPWVRKLELASRVTALQKRLHKFDSSKICKKTIDKHGKKRVSPSCNLTLCT